MDSIIARTRTSSEKVENRIEEAEEAPLESAFLRKSNEENELECLKRELKEKEARMLEREREISELTMLMEARERNLQIREALIRGENNVDAGEASSPVELFSKIDAQERQILRLKNELANAIEDLNLAEAEIGRLEDQLAAIKTAPTGHHDKTPTVPNPDNEQIKLREAEIAEREQMLDEREAFIEESENTLFHKAQELQELETHLEQLKEQLEAAEDKDRATQSSISGDETFLPEIPEEE